MRLTAIALLALGTLSHNQVYAEIEQELTKCVSIQDDTARLACFDLLAKERTALSPTASNASESVGKWRVSADTDPLTDKSIYYAMLAADTGAGSLRRKPILIVRCKDNRTELFINWNNFLGSESTSTTYRIDKDPAKTSNWGLSTDKTAAFFPGSPIPMLKKMADSSSFVANVTPYNESPVTAVFNTSGAANAFADIRKGCNW